MYKLASGIITLAAVVGAFPVSRVLSIYFSRRYAGGKIDILSSSDAQSELPGLLYYYPCASFLMALTIK